MRRKKIKWSSGDIFAIPLLNGKYGVGQILDLMMVNIPRCALYNEVIDDINKVNIDITCKLNDLISLVTITRERLDYGAWKIIGNKEILIPKTQFPFEKLRESGWVGAITHDASIAEDFINAYHALAPWDDWYDPYYFDKDFLIDISKKPKNLIYIKSKDQRSIETS